MKLHHIGLAVNNIDCYYNDILRPLFGYQEISDIIFNASQNVRVAFVGDERHPKLELVEPIDTRSPVYGILKKNKGGLYHLGFISQNFDSDVALLRKSGFFLLSNREGIAFLTSPHFEVYEVINGSVNWGHIDE